MTEDRWQELYINLVNEVDSSRLEQKVAEIEKAFQERLGEIDPQNDAEEYPLLRRTMESVNRLKNQNLRLATFPIMRSKQRESYRPAILVCTTVVDLDRKYVEVSDDFCRLLGYARPSLACSRNWVICKGFGCLSTAREHVSWYAMHAGSGRIR